MNCDVIGFQEVSFVEKNQLRDIYINDEYLEYLAEAQLNYKKVNYIPDDKFNIDGNAILLKQEMLKKVENIGHDILHISPVRTAHMLRFNFNGIEVKYNQKV
jgi:hypothetical protein